VPELWQLTAHEASDLLKRRRISSRELTEASLKRIEAVEPRIRSYLTLTPDVARAHARAADEAIARSEAGPLTGIPMQIKDLICTKGIRTACGSKMLENFVPTYDATVTRKLYDARIVLLGKGNMDEFAMGSSNENSAYYPVHNPWDLNRVPGGSSGGAAASVAAMEAFFALGSDTGGSIRQPASLCGVVGLKPTYGLVSRWGLVAFASSLDQIGPLTRDVTDAALVLNCIAGHDPLESTSIPRPALDYTKALKADIKGMRLGVPKEYYGAGIEAGVKKVMQDGLKVLEDLGARLEEVSLPSTKYALACYYIIAPSECSANLARYDGVKYGYSYKDTDSMWEAMEKTRQFGFGPEVKRRIMLGTYALSAGYYDAYYLKAQKVRTLIRREFEDVFKRVDVLVTPTSPTVAFKLGEKTADPVQMYMSDICTIPVNMAGLPGLVVPCGFSENLPVGMQFIGPHLSEETLFRAAYTYEQATPWHTRWPNL
jgi:aspartyl-tRNA(Asn)/glutamyl-tRNA(Gln) amidotransferase subunit A